MCTQGSLVLISCIIHQSEHATHASYIIVNMLHLHHSELHSDHVNERGCDTYNIMTHWDQCNLMTKLGPTPDRGRDEALTWTMMRLRSKVSSSLNGRHSASSQPRHAHWIVLQ